MTRRITVRAAGFALFLCGGIASSAGSACAQTAKEIAGTYTLVSFTNQQGDKTTDTYGPNPKGAMMLDANGRYVVVLMRPDLPSIEQSQHRDGGRVQGGCARQLHPLRHVQRGGRPHRLPSRIHDVSQLERPGAEARADRGRG